MNLNQLRKLIQEEMGRLYETAPLVHPKPVKLKDNSNQELLGDPVEDVKLNTMIGKAAADKNIVGLVGVKSGSKTDRSDSAAGKPKANFTVKKESPKNNFGAKSA